MTKKKREAAPGGRTYSSLVVDGLKQAPARAMLRAVGFSEGDFAKPQVGVASTWANLTPCNMHINELAHAAVAGADAAGAKGVLFNTITVSDGISMGTPGMFLSQPPMATKPSKPCAPTTVSMESAMTSRDTSE